MRWAQITHEFLKWMGPALFALAGAVITIALAASQIWEGAKAWTADKFTRSVAVMESPWFWVALACVVLIWLAAFIWSARLAHSSEKPGAKPVAPRLEAQPPSLPLDIAFRQKSSWAGWAGLSDDRDRDAWAMQYGPVLLTNLSKTDRLILEIELHLAGPDSADFKLKASDIAPGGRLYGADIQERLRAAGLHSPEIFRSPFTIEPQSSVEGKLLFLTPAYGADLMSKLLPRFVQPDGYNYSMTITDRVSGRSIDIPIADYHGDDPAPR
ncbi:hypothetical protein [Phenylobacterium sp.]|uniref:hypothetical protein n=1 Tax=Phenylobacterium sp. TaxID=1871053 RepID=UPI002720CDE0|nr:hypothetical protein [Phenylobacterium sp.]MDO8378182.1 hypothetical protein [Phenylobacterium sp.]